MAPQSSLTTAACKLGTTILCLWALGACERRGEKAPEPVAASPSPTATISQTEWGQPNINVCALVPKEDVGAIQESPIVDVLSTGRPDGELLVSQCVYTAEVASKSVVMSVMERHPQGGSAQAPQEFWRKIFTRDEERRAEGEKEFVAPRKIEGVGDEAYWMGGALYTLKHQILLRVSVGGPDNVETKLEKSKTLSTKALGRLYP